MNEDIILEDVSEIPETETEIADTEFVQIEQIETVDSSGPEPDTWQDAQENSEIEEIENEYITPETLKQILDEWALEYLVDDSEPAEPLEVTELTVDEPRLFFTTSFDDYTVTEGFCLVFFLMLVIAAIYHFVRRFV